MKTLPKALISFLVAMSVAFLLALSKPSFAGMFDADTDIDQATACVTGDHQNAGDCKPGQKIMFAPARWGNEQLPIMAAVNLCDFRFEIVFTNGAVACIFAGVPETVKIIE